MSILKPPGSPLKEFTSCGTLLQQLQGKRCTSSCLNDL